MSNASELFRLDTEQTLAILESLPSSSRFYECYLGAESAVRYLGTRDDIITAFSHPCQSPIAPAWNPADDPEGTRTLWEMRFVLANELGTSEKEFCVFLGFDYEDINEELPVL